MAYLNVDDPTLLASGHKYRKELLLAPILKVDDLYGQFITRRFDVRGDETVGALTNGAQIKPFTGAYSPTDSTDIDFRTLTTYLGDLTEEFMPTPLSKTIYGNSLDKDIKDFDIVKAVTLAVAGNVGDSLANCLFSATRNASGSTTSTLFDGFYTILSKEITAGAISADNKNMVTVDLITEDNVLDVLKGIYQSASIKLRKRTDLLMYVPVSVLDMYDAAYLQEVGSVVYNDKYNQRYLIGSNDRCTLVPVYEEVDNAPIFITTQSNMLVGCDQSSQEEKVEVRRVNNPHVVQFFMMLYFGCQFQQITSDILMVGVLTAPVVESDSDL